MASYDRRTGGSPRPPKAGDTWWYAAVAGEAADSFSTRVRTRTRRACLGAVLLLTLVYAGLVLTATGRRWGDAAVTGRRADTRVAAFVRDHPSLSGAATLSLVLACLLLVGLGLLRKRYALTGAAAGTVAVSFAATGLLQRYAPRPRSTDAVGALLPSGFPSATATLAFGVAFALVLVVPRRSRGLAVGAATLWAVVLGAYSVAAGDHRPGDVISAALLALAVQCGLIALLARRGKVRPGARHGALLRGLPATLPLALLAAGGLAAGFLLLGDTLGLPETAPYDPEELRLAHRCGQALAAGTGAACGLVLLALVRHVALDGGPASYRLGGTFVEASGVPDQGELVGPFTENHDHEIS
ncbi:phosphatase PAP2 family protein [Streptomyces sp. CC208A]|uniref:phosphatase PAP2 family protein n=1 Tax=Streptomyces sp. CC208A TaxID=3044573 RepID=UPI0024A8B025|nr:phosphatase PAP2 family protein [Streptomyces sp. CC208A]